MNKDLKELKKIITDNDPSIFEQTVVNCYPIHSVEACHICKTDIQCDEQPRPLTIADVLRVYLEGTTDIFENPNDRTFRVRADVCHIVSMWNLKEDLDNQTPETWKNLLSILK